MEIVTIKYVPEGFSSKNICPTKFSSLEIFIFFFHYLFFLMRQFLWKFAFGIESLNGYFIPFFI